MKPELFAELAAQGFNHIPVTEEVLADLDTPRGLPPRGRPGSALRTRFNYRPK